MLPTSSETTTRRRHGNSHHANGANENDDSPAQAPPEMSMEATLTNENGDTPAPVPPESMEVTLTNENEDTQAPAEPETMEVASTPGEEESASPVAGEEYQRSSRSNASRGSKGEHHISKDLDIDPPRSRYERFRDWVLRGLDHPFFQVMGLFVMFLVVADGALFFFMLMGWHNLCEPKTDCEPRNQMYNISVQILNGLFTYMCTVSFPWRVANAVHVFGLGFCCCSPVRDNSLGKGLYGLDRPDDIWFHFPIRHRRGIVVLLILNTLTQYANQTTRIIFHTYELQDTMPGVIWVNVFFLASLLTGFVAAVWVVWLTFEVPRHFPDNTFGGPPDLVLDHYNRRCGCCHSRLASLHGSARSGSMEDYVVGREDSLEAGDLHPSVQAEPSSLAVSQQEGEGAGDDAEMGHATAVTTEGAAAAAPSSSSVSARRRRLRRLRRGVSRGVQQTRRQFDPTQDGLARRVVKISRGTMRLFGM